MLEENYDKGHEDHRIAYEALQQSILRDESEQFDADNAEERKKMKTIKEENVKEENLCDMDKEFETRPNGTYCFMQLVQMKPLRKSSRFKAE
ncbi:hypothetical protein Tco_0730961 [Tanacetum coccineum]